MANTTKTRRNKKKVVAYSVKTGIAEDFVDNCKIKGLIPSNEVEKLIVEFNKQFIEE